ncbi:MAG TPA: sigma-70 family RNA polymerase sigma factor [Opitutus sp.]|nr:sigma-70 family RNA polymerase sigma factor [Opitutus sp.]
MIDAARAERRRLAREQAASTMLSISSAPEATADWAALRPVLDDAMDTLTARDREAVLLRFFQNRPFAEISRVLGVSEDAARKRADRALETLRRVLIRRGIDSTAAALAAILAGETAVAAPAGLAASVAASAVAGTKAALLGAAFMTITKTQAAIAAFALLGGAGGLILQHQTSVKLRAANATLQREATRLAAENRQLAKARTEAETELTRFKTELKPSPATAPIAFTAARSQDASARPAVGPRAPRPRESQQPSQLHERYDSFLRERGLSPADIDRWIELMREKENIRLDLQAAVREYGGRGGTKEIEDLRSKLSDGLWREMFAMLGPDGAAAFHDFEQTSYYRGFLQPLTPALAAANIPLSADQSARLVRLLVANDHPQRENATDLGAESRIDWPAVIQQAGNFLTPAQQSALHDFADQRRPR